MYSDLLLATDGSDGARRATNHAIQLARELEADLHVVSVAEEGPHSTDRRDEMRSDPEGEAHEAAEEAAREAENAGLEATTTIRHGVAQEEIVAVAEANPIDAIVVGTVGRSGIDKILLGSVAEEVVRNAPVPVVTVRERS
ncbi:Nucleotide-binding universal stress protein, UspA family [Halobiforma haloterrestris]|uniref:Nucleotide-binding universal stress protein, UspA family n=1 Tax=Natronobacterium haloterrestre TaxID=148448 RepID=A0A1I1F482_NATHA|nr:universal stress protein [Halobiforma haloterrestris]SFB94269.1 Nucleotide-binding universal stress protein, UspA family [Halobiforma haloterrestris]